MKTISKNLALFLFGFALISYATGCQAQSKKCNVCGTYYLSFQANYLLLQGNNFPETISKAQDFILSSNPNITDQELNDFLSAVINKMKGKPVSKEIEKKISKLMNTIYIALNADGSWEYFSLNNSSEPIKKGTWEIKENPIMGKIINVCVGQENWENRKDCVIKFGTVGTEKQYLKWDGKMFFKK